MDEAEHKGACLAFTAYWKTSGHTYTLATGEHQYSDNVYVAKIKPATPLLFDETDFDVESNSVSNVVVRSYELGCPEHVLENFR